MVTKEHRAMRREQMERWLASDGMTVEEWCRLNRMSTSTFYLWPIDLYRFLGHAC